MIGKRTLSQRDKEVLRGLVKNTCQNCGKQEDVVGKLQAHRFVRETEGGLYSPNNILMFCNRCHRDIHSNEMSNCKGK